MTQRQQWIFVAFLVTCILLSVYAMEKFAVASHWGDSWGGATLAGMVSGRAERPYVYRVLVPSIVAFFLRITPDFFRQSIGEVLWSLQASPLVDAVFLQNPYAHPNPGALHWFRTLCYMRMITGMTLSLCLAGYTAALYKLASVLFPNRPSMALCTPVIGLICVPALHGIYIYDFPSLCLAACGYYCLSVRKWGWYIFWFELACLNKETSIFLCIFYALWFCRRLPASFFTQFLGLQLAIYILIKGTITWWFAGNPGVFIMTGWQHLQLAAVMRGYNYTALLTYLAGMFILTYDWQEKPPFARYGLWLLLLMLAAFFFFGRPGEYRVFYDILPLMTVLITHTVIGATGISRSLDEFWTFRNADL